MIASLFITSIIFCSAHCLTYFKSNDRKWNYSYSYLQEPYLASSNFITTHQNKDEFVEPKVHKPMIHKSVFNERIVSPSSFINYIDKNIYHQHRHLVNNLRNELLAEFQSIGIPNFGPNFSYPQLSSFSPPPSPSFHSPVSSLKSIPTSPWLTSQPLTSPPSYSQEVKTDVAKFGSNNYRYFDWHPPPQHSSNLLSFQSYSNLAPSQNYPPVPHNHQHNTMELGHLDSHLDSNSLEINREKNYHYNQVGKSPVKFNNYNYGPKYPTSNYDYAKHTFINNLNPEYMAFDDHYSHQNDSIQNKIDHYFSKIQRHRPSPNHNPTHYIFLKTTSSNHAHTLEKVNAWDIPLNTLQHSKSYL